MAEEQQLQKYDFGKNCVCIGRVSTSIQSQTSQTEDLKKFANRLGYEKVQPFFSTESGFLEFDDKLGWNLVTDFFDTHPDYRVLICAEMSRLSRREAILFKIKDYLKANKIQLIIKDINFSLFDEWGNITKGNEIVFALFASLADSEMRQKKERFRRSLSDNRTLGYSIGGKRLFGYDRYYEMKDGKNRSKYRINEEEAEQIRTVYRWYAFGIDGDLSKTSIVEVTKKCIEEGFAPYLHSRRNVNKCLKEQAYIGQKETHNRVHNAEYWSYRDQSKPKYIEGNSFICTYPPIFTGEDAALFEKVQLRLRQNNSKFNKDGVPVDKSTNHITILSKLVRCPECGHFLNGEYRVVKHDKRRPNLGTRYYYTYRCSYSRGVVNKCSYKHVLSMPLMDSVVWAYCQEPVLYLMESEKRRTIEERIEEIDRKISNIDERIKTYNYEDRVKGEEAILRSKLTILKTPVARDAAISDFQEHIDALNKELNEFETRKLELEKEKKDVKRGESLVGLLARKRNITADKRQIYQYVHQLVDSIQLVFCDREYTVLRIRLKKQFGFSRPDEYVCVRKRTTRRITALVIHPVDLDLVRTAVDPKRSVRDWKIKIEELHSQDNLRWQTDKGVFDIDGYYFSLDDLFTYHQDPMALYKLPIEERAKHVDISDVPVFVKELDVERLICYEEDKKG